MPDDTKKSGESENAKAARLAGAGAGVLAGAQVGTVLLPIPVIGTFAGALVGGLVGTKIGKKVGGALLDKFAASADSENSSGRRSELLRELEQLSKLRDAGVLTEAEFLAAKARLLGL